MKFQKGVLSTAGRLLVLFFSGCWYTQTLLLCYGAEIPYPLMTETENYIHGNFCNLGNFCFEMCGLSLIRLDNSV